MRETTFRLTKNYGRQMSKNEQIRNLAGVNASNRSKKRDKPENRLVMQIIHYLKAKGYAIGKVKTTGAIKRGSFLKDPYLWTGLPDLLVFTPGLVFLEVKTGKNKQTPNQKDFEHFCKLAGITYFVVYNLDEVVDIFG